MARPASFQAWEMRSFTGALPEPKTMVWRCAGMLAMASERGSCQKESISWMRSWVLPLGPATEMEAVLRCLLKCMCSSSVMELRNIVRSPLGLGVMTASVCTGRITRSSVSRLMIRPSLASISTLLDGRTSRSWPIAMYKKSATFRVTSSPGTVLQYVDPNGFIGRAAIGCVCVWAGVIIVVAACSGTDMKGVLATFIAAALGSICHESPEFIRSGIF